jgi:hypothetical protein
MGKRSFVVYYDWFEAMNNIGLSTFQIGSLFEALGTYVTKGNVENIEDQQVNVLFQIFKMVIDRDQKKYNEKCEKMKKNANGRWNN